MTIPEWWKICKRYDGQLILIWNALPTSNERKKVYVSIYIHVAGQGYFDLLWQMRHNKSQWSIYSGVWSPSTGETIEGHIRWNPAHTYIYIYCPTRMQDKNVNIWFAKRINFYSQTVLLYALYTFRTRKCVIHHTKVKVIEMIWPHNKRECNTKWVLIWLHNERGNATRSELHGLFIIHMNLSIRVQILSLSYVLVINFYTSWYPHR